MDRFSITRETWETDQLGLMMINDDREVKGRVLPEGSVSLLSDLSLPLQEQLGSGMGRALGEEVGGQTRAYAGAVTLLQQRVRWDPG